MIKQKFCHSTQDAHREDLSKAESTNDEAAMKFIRFRYVFLLHGPMIPELSERSVMIRIKWLILLNLSE